MLREGNIGEVYNIGSHAEKTNLEVTEAILDAVGASDDLIESLRTVLATISDTRSTPPKSKR